MGKFEEVMSKMELKTPPKRCMEALVGFSV
jgi:hypothetical protein